MIPVTYFLQLSPYFLAPPKIVLPAGDLTFNTWVVRTFHIHISLRESWEDQNPQSFPNIYITCWSPIDNGVFYSCLVQSVPCPTGIIHYIFLKFKCVPVKQSSLLSTYFDFAPLGFSIVCQSPAAQIAFFPEFYYEFIYSL
jgi:hypothetical protein